MAATLDIAKSVVQEVGLETQVTPALRANPFASSSPQAPGVGGWLMREVVKPLLWVKTPGGTARWAPYGEPTVDYVPTLVVGGLAAAGVAAATVFAVGVWWGRRR